LGVKITFFEYPYTIETPINFEKIFRLPDLLTLAAMKAFALGRHSKWKDYVDMYFLLKYHFHVEDIEQKAINIYGQEFSGKLFRSQLAYHTDIDYREEVEYMEGYAVEADAVKAFLIEEAVKF
jgi:hypothetical protein